MKRALPTDAPVSASKRARRAEPDVPCVDVADIWLGVVVPCLVQEGFACRTLVALRRVCRWFAVHVEAPNPALCEGENPCAWLAAYQRECNVLIADGRLDVLSWPLAFEANWHGCPMFEEIHCQLASRALLALRTDAAYYAFHIAYPIPKHYRVDAAIECDLVHVLRLHDIKYPPSRLVELIGHAYQHRARRCFARLVARLPLYDGFQDGGHSAVAMELRTSGYLKKIIDDGEKTADLFYVREIYTHILSHLGGHHYPYVGRYYQLLTWDEG